MKWPAVIFASLLLLNSCKSASQTSSLRGEISFFTNRTDKASTTLKALADEFQKLHPGTTIKVFAYKRAMEHLDALFNAGQLYDVSPIPLSMKKEEFPAHLLPLDSLGIKGEDITVEGNGRGADGKLYAIASGINYLGFIYNRTAFAKAAVAHPPRSFDELLAACGKLAEAKITAVELNYRELWTLERYVRSLAALLVKAAGKDTEDVAVQQTMFDKGGALQQVFQMMLDMKSKGCFGESMLTSLWEENKARHASGLIGMAFLETWYIPQVLEHGGAEADFGMFPFPGVDLVAVSSEWAYGVSKKSPNPELALAWLKFILEENRLAKATNAFLVRTEKGLNPTLTELFALSKNVVPTPPMGGVVRRAEKAGFSLETAIQELLVASEPEQVLERYKKSWSKTF